MTPEEREARLRAARRMQDDIYEGIGATDRPPVDGRGAARRGEEEPGIARRAAGIASSALQGRENARRQARDMTEEGTRPLRDLLASRAADPPAMDYDEDDSQVMGKPRKAGKKPPGGY